MELAPAVVVLAASCTFLSLSLPFTAFQSAALTSPSAM